MVPLKGVNRTLIRRGLAELACSTRPGVIALKQVSSIAAGEVTAGQVGFRLGPRINAAGRVDYGIKVVELLTTDSHEVAMRIAQELDAHNGERRAHRGGSAGASAGAGESCRRWRQVAIRWCWPAKVGIPACSASSRRASSRSFHRPTVVIGLNGGAGKGFGAQHPRLSYGRGISPLRRTVWKNSAATNIAGGLVDQVAR